MQIFVNGKRHLKSFIEFYASSLKTQGVKIFEKASKRLYCLIQLKRAKVARTDLGLFYSSCIRSIMGYAVLVFTIVCLNNNNNNNNNNNEFAVAFPRGGSSSTVSRSNWNLEVLVFNARNIRTCTEESNVYHLSDHSYHEALDIMNFKELAIHHYEICESLFDTIVNDNNYRLNKLLPATHETPHLLNFARPFDVPHFTTNRFKSSFIISCLKAHSS